MDSNKAPYAQFAPLSAEGNYPVNPGYAPAPNYPPGANYAPPQYYPPANHTDYQYVNNPGYAPAPGYLPQGQPYGYPPGQFPPGAPYVHGAPINNKSSMESFCPICNHKVITKVVKRPGNTAWCICLILGFFCFPFCLYPLLCDPCLDTYHLCPKCLGVISVKSP